MRVAWIPPHFEYGERIFFPDSFLLARRLVQRGVQTVIIAPRAFRESAHEVIDGVEIFRSKDVSLPFKRFRYPLPLLLYRRIMQVVRDLNIDVINWHGYHYLSASLLPIVKRRTGIPCVLTVIGFPGVTWHYPVKAIDFISRLYAYSLGKIVLNSADRVVIDFPHNVDGARKLGLAENKLEHISWSIDTDLFRPIPGKRREMRARLGFTEGDFVIGYCGRLSQVKGIDALLSATEQVISRNENARLLIIGGGGDGLGGDSYEKKARALLRDKVIITGWVKQEDVPIYLQAADLGVQPSLAESGGGGAMQSAACGLPVIASRTGGLQDTVSNGITGLLIEPGDAGGLSRGIMSFVEHPGLREEMGKAGRDYIVKNFGQERTTEKYLQLYSRLTQA